MGEYDELRKRYSHKDFVACSESAGKFCCVCHYVSTMQVAGAREQGEYLETGGGVGVGEQVNGNIKKIT